MKVLIVDDEQLVRWFLERALRRWGYEVITAANVKEAIKNLKDNNIDILFTDLKMPEENGTVLLEKVSDLTDSLKVVVCSAFITPEMDKEFRQKGIYSLKKPFKLEELENTLKLCMEQ
ncbi:MAG: response regulator [Thermodesulfovibrionales bacterium]|nr:response regulator [Thermodesulfovibrionales bacterium]MDP3110993.1 response regulator [Thermodesulfovibrionales bacterium]